MFPNSVNVKDYFYSETSRVKVRYEWGIDDSEFVIGAVGRLVEQKNYPFLLSLFSEFHASHPSCVLAIAGEGELRQPIESEIQKLGLQDSVRILGRYDDMPASIPPLTACAFRLFTKVFLSLHWSPSLRSFHRGQSRST